MPRGLPIRTARGGWEILRRPAGEALSHLAHPEAPVHIYQGAGHGFTCDERGSFHKEAADTSKKRALEFFAEHLTGPARKAA